MIQVERWCVDVKVVVTDGDNLIVKSCKVADFFGTTTSLKEDKELMETSSCLVFLSLMSHTQADCHSMAGKKKKTVTFSV